MRRSTRSTAKTPKKSEPAETPRRTRRTKRRKSESSNSDSDEPLAQIKESATNEKVTKEDKKQEDGSEVPPRVEASEQVQTRTSRRTKHSKPTRRNGESPDRGEKDEGAIENEKGDKREADDKGSKATERHHELPKENSTPVEENNETTQDKRSESPRRKRTRDGTPQGSPKKEAQETPGKKAKQTPEKEAQEISEKEAQQTPEKDAQQTPEKISQQPPKEEAQQTPEKESPRTPKKEAQQSPEKKEKEKGLEDDTITEMSIQKDDSTSVRERGRKGSHSNNHKKSRSERSESEAGDKHHKTRHRQKSESKDAREPDTENTSDNSSAATDKSTKSETMNEVSNSREREDEAGSETPRLEKPGTDEKEEADRESIESSNKQRSPQDDHHKEEEHSGLEGNKGSVGSLKDFGDDDRAKGKLKGKHRSKVEKSTSWRRDEEARAQGEISKNVQVTSASPTPYDNPSDDPGVTGDTEMRNALNCDRSQVREVFDRQCGEETVSRTNKAEGTEDSDKRTLECSGALDSNEKSSERKRKTEGKSRKSDDDKSGKGDERSHKGDEKSSRKDEKSRKNHGRSRKDSSVENRRSDSSVENRESESSVENQKTDSSVENRKTDSSAENDESESIVQNLKCDSSLEGANETGGRSKETTEVNEVEAKSSREEPAKDKDAEISPKKCTSSTKSKRDKDSDEETTSSAEPGEIPPEKLQLKRDQPTGEVRNQRPWGLALNDLEKVFPNLTVINYETISQLYDGISLLEENEVKLEIESKDKNFLDKVRMDRKISIEHRTSEPEIESRVEMEDAEDKSNIIAMNRKISIVDDTASKMRPPPSPAKNPVSAILYITNLVRPFTLKQLKEMLERTGKIREDGFWTDKIKSKCYVHYENEEEAEATRNAIHGVHWPIGNGKKLMIEYATAEEMDRAKNPPAPPQVQPVVVPEVPVVPEKENEEPPKKRTKQVSESEGKEKERRRIEDHQVREWDLGKGETRKRHSRSRSRERHRSRDKRRHRRTPSPHDDYHKHRREDDAVPQKLMDDLFMKTKTMPSIFWQPLSPEEINMKQQQRLQRMAEHKRRIEESSQRGRMDFGRSGPFRRRFD